MKKSIIISIKPEWVEKILNREKTIEIRKSMPKCDLPVDVYIYCTKGNLYAVKEDNYDTNDKLFNYKTYYQNEYEELAMTILNGKIVAKFTLKKVEEIKLEYVDHPELGYGVNENCGDDWYEWESDDLLENCCLTYEELYKYGNHENIYAWHIDNLEIFDEPLELGNFLYECKKHLKSNGCKGCLQYYYNCNESVGFEEECLADHLVRLTKAPQSWCYAYKEKI